MQLAHQYLFDSALRHPSKSALVCDSEEMSYSSLAERIHAVGDVCIVEGLRKGDRVLLLLQRKCDFVVAAYAVMRAGGIAVPVPERSSPETLQQIAKDCSPSIVITNKADLAHYPLLRDKVSCSFLFLEDVLSATASHSSTVPRANEALERIAKLMELKETDNALILYTGNYDGHLRGAVFTHQSLTRTAVTTNALTRVDETTNEFISSPLTQSIGFGRLQCLLFVGGTINTRSTQFAPVEVVRHILKYGCNAISFTPQNFSLVCQHASALMKQVSGQIRFVELATPSLSASGRRQITEMFPHARICLQYGLTEIPRSTFMDFGDHRRKQGTVGKPAPYAEISIVDDHGAPLHRGQTGQIVVRGDHRFAGYWRANGSGFAPQDSSEWFHTGDIGVLDREGFLSVLGRKEEIINLAGLKISPVEVEEKIHEIYPGVEICVIGIPDPAGVVGEIPVLCYEAKENKTIISSELSSALATRLEKDKIPRIVYRVAHLPKINNVVSRKELRLQLLQGAPASLQQEIS